MKRILIFLNYISVFSLLLAYVAPFIDPQIFWPIALFGLAYPFLLMVNVLFLLWWIFRGKKHLWLSLITLIIGFPYIGRYIQVGNSTDSGSPEAWTLNIVSYNVRLFDLYNWKNDENELTRDKIYSFLSDEESDILCLQEYYANDNGEFSSFWDIMEVQKAKYKHIANTISIGPANWGIAIFSKYPLVNSGQVAFEAKSNNICIFSDIVVGEDTLRIYNAHLGSVHFGYEEYELLEKVGQQQGSRDSQGPQGASDQVSKARDEDVPYVDVVTTMVKLLRTAFVNRASQTIAVADHAATSPYPVIICGDINDTPMSYAYSCLAQGRRDAFRAAGSGFGNTYAGVLPFLRIDYLFYDEEIELVDFSTRSDVAHSDHYPLSCKLGL